MSTIHLHREHHLGLAKARKIAVAWAEQVEAEFGMDCTIEEGEDADTIHFTRSGVKGVLEVNGETFELNAKLGLLLGALRGVIESHVEKELDKQLAAAGKAKKPAAKKK